MGLAQETLATLDEILKEDFYPGVASMLYSNTDLLSIFEANSERMNGKNIAIKYRIGGNQGGGNAKVRATLPTAGGRKFEEGTETTRNYYAPMDIPGQELDMLSTEDAFVSLLADATTDTAEQGRNQLNRQSWGDGSARLGTVASIDGTNKIVTLDEGHAVHYPYNMQVNIRSTAGTNRGVGGVLEIDTSDLDAMTITFDTAFSGVIAGDYLYQDGQYDESFDLEMLGLAAHISETDPPMGTYQGKNRATAGNKFLRGLVFGNSGTPRDLARNLLTGVFDQIKLNGQVPGNEIHTSPGVRNSYIQLLEAAKQIVTPVVSKTGWTEVLEFVYGGQAKRLTVIPDAPRTKMWIFNKKNFAVKQTAPLRWDNRFGMNRLNPHETIDKFWARMYWYANFICSNPQGNAVIEDIKPDSDFT